MAEIIAPRRPQDWFKDNGEFTRRANRFFEETTEVSNQTVEDVIATEQALTSTSSRVSRNAARINSIELKEFEIVNTTVGLTTEEYQIIICKNVTPIIITLDPQAVEDDEVHIKRRGEEVEVIGTIDGLTDLTINVPNYSVHLVFDGSDWSII
jgi:hypothetical protein